MPDTKKLMSLVVGMLLVAVQTAPAKTAMEWLHELDYNMVMKSAQYMATMTVHLPSGQERMFKMECKVVGDQYAMMEYTEPKRDLGTRYLKRDDELWIYFPRVDRTMLIQGHMLRQGVQGGDMSFEDMTESKSWEDIYDAEIVKQDSNTVTIKMTAHDMTTSYPYREIVIDKRTSLPMLEVSSDASESPIKETEILSYKKIGDRNFPTSVIIRSRLVDNKWTKFEMSDVKLDVKFDESQFTKRALEE
ncbi:MAG: outer membrane lipoprotein-sorting protein [bacterium]